MLRSVFFGSQNSFNDALVHWLAQRTELRGVVWTTSTRWQATWQGRISFARKRVRRSGVVRTIDEVLFYYCYRLLLANQEDRLFRDLLGHYWEQHGNERWEGPSLVTADVNRPEVLDFVARCQPDLALAMCINNYFGSALRGIPGHGIFLWHEGFTPEYKGLYSPFWAVHNLDFEHMGYTLLRMNEKFDDGEVFVQGQVHGVDPLRDPPAYIGHKAVMDSLPAVAQFLQELEAGTAKPLECLGRAGHLYSYPGLSDWIRQRIRLRRQNGKQAFSGR